MNCETAQEQVSLLIDAELEEPSQATLFSHLETCSECRHFFDSMVRFRKAAIADREGILLTASEVLPERSPARADRRAARIREARWSRVFAGRWRMPAPVGVGLAVILLLTGAFLGARFARISGGDRPEWTSERTVKPAVIVVCGLPEFEVVGSGVPR